MSDKSKNYHRICHIELDEKTIIRRNSDIEHERRVAIFDLLDKNYFAPKIEGLSDYLKEYNGPYHITLRIEENRLAIDLKTQTMEELSTLVLPLSPLRRVIKEYFLVCDSYFSAIKTSSPSQIEAIDIGRRALHNEGAQIMKSRYDAKVDVDFETARRLFTLICVLHIR